MFNAPAAKRESVLPADEATNIGAAQDEDALSTALNVQDSVQSGCMPQRRTVEPDAREAQ